MKTKIKSTNPFNACILKDVYRKRAVLAAFLLIAAGAFFTARDWQPTVSGQELFGTPKFELPLSTNPVLPSDANVKKASARHAQIHSAIIGLMTSRRDKP